MNLQEELISICMPTYNRPVQFERALLSVLEQDYPHIEIIVTDDSTTDGVEETIRPYLADKRITYTRNKPPLGPARNWNQGLQLAAGEYIKILHHDDWLDSPSVLSAFLARFHEDHSIGFVFSACKRRDSSGKTTGVHRINQSEFAGLQANSAELYPKNIIGPPSAIMVKKKIPAFFDPRLQWCVDIDFYLEVLDQTRVAYIVEPLINVTGDDPEQLTRQCEFNDNILRFEWIYLFLKRYSSLKSNVGAYIYLLSILKKYKLHNVQSIRNLGIEYPVPNFLVACIFCNRFFSCSQFLKCIQRVNLFYRRVLGRKPS